MYEKENFQTVWEHYMSRYTAGAFAIGDVLEFDKKIFRDSDFKSLPTDLRDRLKDMIDAQINGDAIIVVANISLCPLNSDHPAPSTITIAYSLGGGRYHGPLTIPGQLLAYAERNNGDGVNLPNLIPDKVVVNYDKRFSKTAFPVDTAELERKRTKGYIEIKDPNKNVKPKNKKKSR